MKNIASTPFPLDPPVSICPAGECFPLPNKDDEAAEFIRLQKLVTEQRLLGREIVVVMGMGLVGAVMAGVVADSVNRDTQKPGKYVIGMQRPSPRSFWKNPIWTGVWHRSWTKIMISRRFDEIQ